MIAPAPVAVSRRRFCCGCLTGYTEAGYLAETEFCEEGLALQTELLDLRARQRGMDLDHPCLPAAVAALGAREAAITAHRTRAGLATISERECRAEIGEG